MQFDSKTREPMIDGARGRAMHNGRVVDTDDRLTDRHGEINASSKSELMAKISAVAQDKKNGRILDPQAAVDLHADIRRAFKTGDQKQMQISGSVIADELYETMNREGIVDEVYVRKDVADGTDNRIPVRRKDVTAHQLMNDGETIESVSQQAFYYPNDFYLTCKVVMEDRDLAQRGPELMDEKFADGLEATMTRRDRIARAQWISTKGVFNNPIGYTAFTPQVASSLITQVASNGLSVAHMVVAYDVWDDLRADPTFAAYWDPVSKFQLIQDGRLGSLFNVKIITDGFRHQNLKVLLPGEVFVLASPVSLGMHSVRQAVAATEINEYSWASPRRGWFFEGIESLITLDRGVATATRL